MKLESTLQSMLRIVELWPDSFIMPCLSVPMMVTVLHAVAVAQEFVLCTSGKGTKVQPIGGRPVHKSSTHPSLKVHSSMQNSTVRFDVEGVLVSAASSKVLAIRTV
jgi:hypothetical protein